MTHPSLHALTAIGRIGRYELIGRLAMGGMAEIYLARESGPGSAQRELVVKRVLPHVANDARLIDMFMNEARLCMRLRHPHICPIYEFGEDRGAYFLAMEWVDGVSVAALSRRMGELGSRLPVDYVAHIGADVAGALHHAHTAHDEAGRPLKIVHRDVTPENVMVSYQGQVKLLDFGIAKAKTQLDKTQAGVLKGKFGYMSPEQYRGEEVDARSDVFSLGIVLHELLAGRPLFERDNEYETVAAIVLDETVPSVREVRPEVPEALDAILQRALARDREARFASADEMQAALQRFLAESRAMVRDAELASLLARSFSDEIATGPALDRHVAALPASGPVSPLDEMERHALDAHLDDAEEGFARAGRRKRVAVGLLAALVVLFTVGAVLFSLREEPASAAPSGPVDASSTARPFGPGPASTAEASPAGSPASEGPAPGG